MIRHLTLAVLPLPGRRRLKVGISFRHYPGTHHRSTILTLSVEAWRWGL